MSMMKVPDKTLDKILDVMKSGKEFTDEEINELRRVIDEARAEEKAKADKTDDLGNRSD
jgi:hypothetical protein